MYSVVRISKEGNPTKDRWCYSVVAFFRGNYVAEPTPYEIRARILDDQLLVEQRSGRTMGDEFEPAKIFRVSSIGRQKADDFMLSSAKEVAKRKLKELKPTLEDLTQSKEAL